MIKKLLLVAVIALQFVAVTPVANASIDLPECFPCDGK
jgi:hypothetical protein